MPYDRPRFFAAVRPLFGPLTPQQVGGFENLLDGLAGRHDTALFQVDPALPLPAAAYLLATSWRETGATMQPITEWGGKRYFDKYDVGRLAAALGNTPQKDGDGFLFRGRGLAQITGRSNYARLGQRLGIDLIADPELALEPATAFRILYLGLCEGRFTGRTLAEFVNTRKVDYFNARRTVNGTDHAMEIADHARTFERALRAAEKKSPETRP